jgi:ubiquinone/menaquinone biosynthesis C-methylase UbiE
MTMRHVLRLSAVVGALAVTVTLAAQQRDPEQYARMLESRERVEHMEVDRVVAALGLSPGTSVADLGSGSGLFTRPLARAVAPGGTAFAVDIDPKLLDIVNRSAGEAGLTNIVTVLAAPDDPKLPGPVDLVFICDAFHHLPDKPQYAHTLARYVKPGGRVAVIDFASNWPPGHEAMQYTAQDLDRWMAAAGFTRTQAFDFPENSFFVVYKR